MNDVDVFFSSSILTLTCSRSKDRFLDLVRRQVLGHPSPPIVAMTGGGGILTSMGGMSRHSVGKSCLCLSAGVLAAEAEGKGGRGEERDGWKDDR